MSTAKTMRGYGLLILTLGLIGAQPAVLADPPAAPFAQQMVELFKMVGRWTVDETYHNPSGVTGRGTAQFEQALDNTHLVLNYSSKTKEWKLEGHGVFTYDEDAGKLRYWWFANVGRPRSFSGAFNSAKQSLVFTEDSTQFPIQRHTFHTKNKDEMEFKLESSEDGKSWQVDLTTLYARKGSKRGEEEEQPQDEAKKRPPAIRG
jgi:hypothetical protein